MKINNQLWKYRNGFRMIYFKKYIIFKILLKSNYRYCYLIFFGLFFLWLFFFCFCFFAANYDAQSCVWNAVDVLLSTLCCWNVSAVRAEAVSRVSGSHKAGEFVKLVFSWVTKPRVSVTPEAILKQCVLCEEDLQFHWFPLNSTWCMKLKLFSQLHCRPNTHTHRHTEFCLCH